MERDWKVKAVFLWWGGCSRPGERRGWIDTTGVLCPDSLSWAENCPVLNYTLHKRFLPGNPFLRGREEPRDYLSCVWVFKIRPKNFSQRSGELVIIDIRDEVVFPVK